MTKQNSTERQKGFILIVAITILMGLLAIVTTLVRVNKDNTRFQQNFLKTNQTLNAVFDTGIGWVEYIFRNRSSSAGVSPHPYSRIQQNWWADGTQGIPFSLKLQRPVQNTSHLSSLRVQSLLNVFMALAVNKDTGTTIDTSNMYTITNEELFRDGVKIGGGVPFNYSSIVSDPQEYGISSAMQVGYVNIKDRWLKVDSWTISGDDDQLNCTELDLRGDNSNYISGTGDIITYYPFDPSLNIGLNEGTLRISFKDEAGKININSLTQSGLSSLGINFDDYVSAMTLSNAYKAHRNYQGIANRSGNTTFSGLIEDQTYTPYSKSLIPRRYEAQVLRGNVVTNDMLYVNTLPAGGQLIRASAGSNEIHLVTPHPVNINSAPRNSLTVHFDSILNNEGDALDLSLSVLEYRTNFFATSRQAPNPFDGVNSSDLSNLKYYSGPEEEFRDFLLDVNDDYPHDLAPTQIKRLMAHAYYEGFDIQNRIDGNVLCQPIGFEWDDTWNISIISTAGYADRNSSTRSQNLVVVPVNRTSIGTVHINSSTGWNRAYSTFNGVTRKQPQVQYNTSTPDKIVLDESGVFSDELGYFHVNGGMVAKVGESSSPIDILSFLKNSDDVGTQGNLVYAIDRRGLTLDTELGSSNVIDLGLRPITRDREDLGDLFGANVSISGNYGPGAMTIYTTNNVSPSDTTLWANQWMVFGDNVASPEHIRVSGVAGNAITLATALDFSLSPDDVLYYVPEFHPDYFEQAENNDDHPFYETVVHIPGAYEAIVSWDDSSSYGTRPQVLADWFNPDTGLFEDLTEGDPITIKNYVRLRFSFDNPAGGLISPPIVPQLFGIQLTYRVRRDAPPMYVLNRN